MDNNKLILSDQKKPKVLRPIVLKRDYNRFLNIHYTLNHKDYSETITHLLDVYEEAGVTELTNQNMKITNAWKNFLKVMKETNPSMYKDFMNQLED